MDGNYGWVQVAEFSRLAYTVNLEQVTAADSRGMFEVDEYAQCRFSGTVVTTVDAGLAGKHVVVDAAGFLFYIDLRIRNLIEPPESGSWIAGTGSLKMDDFPWTERLQHIEGAPDIFRTARVTRIVRVDIPGRHVSRHDGTMVSRADGSQIAELSSHPASLPPGMYGRDSMVEVTSTEYDDKVDPAFFLISFEDDERRGEERVFHCVAGPAWAPSSLSAN